MASVLSGKLQSWNASETLQTAFRMHNVAFFPFPPTHRDLGSSRDNLRELLSRSFQRTSYLDSPFSSAAFHNFTCTASNASTLRHKSQEILVRGEEHFRTLGKRLDGWGCPKCRLVLLTVHAGHACQIPSGTIFACQHSPQGSNARLTAISTRSCPNIQEVPRAGVTKTPKLRNL
jgi:hypothetical protein